MDRFVAFWVKSMGVTPYIFDVTGSHWMTKYYQSAKSYLKLGE